MIRARTLIAAVALMLAAAACNSGDLPAPTEYATVSGVILDHATNNPIAGATVTVDTILTAVTDAKGNFSIDKVPTGDFDYNVAAKGYTTFNGSGSAEPGKNITLDLALNTTIP